MQEHQVTIAGETHRVPEPFLVMATQNPIETEGTYPLPEAQVDRFMMKVLVGYPSEEEEFVIVERVTGSRAGRRARWPPPRSCAALQRECRKVYVDPSLMQYAVRLVAATRDPDALRPQGPRASYLTLRREPARHDPPDRRRARARVPARPRLRAARGRDRPRARRAAPPAVAVLRSAGRRHDAPTSIVIADHAAACPRRTSRCETHVRRRRDTPDAILRAPRVDGDPPARRAAAGRLPHAVPRLRPRSRRPARIPVPRRRPAHRLERHGALQTPYVRDYNEDREVTAWFLLDLSARRSISARGRAASARCRPSSSRCSRACSRGTATASARCSTATASTR